MAMSLCNAITAKTLMPNIQEDNGGVISTGWKKGAAA